MYISLYDLGLAMFDHSRYVSSGSRGRKSVASSLIRLRIPYCLLFSTLDPIPCLHCFIKTVHQLKMVSHFISIDDTLSVPSVSKAPSYDIAAVNSISI